MSVAKVLNEREVAAEFGVTPSTVRRWRLQLGMPHFRTAGRVFCRLEKILEWMDKMEQSSSQEAETEKPEEYGVLRRIR